MKRSILKKGLLLVAAALSFASCDAWKEDIRLKDNGRSNNLYEAIASNPELSTFAEILRLAGYDKFLQEEQALTVFAPQNSALSGINTSDTDKLKEWVKNYIAYLAYCTDESGKFETDNIRMLNNKNVPVNAAGISGAGIVRHNLMSSNGVLHIIDNTIIDRKNIWEYLDKQTGYAQIDFIRSINEQVMDKERSVQKGVDMEGRPIYDTIWVTRNDFLEEFPLDDETQAFTFLLLEQSAWEYLMTKYAKYMRQDDPEKQEKTIKREITADMMLLPVEITEDGRFVSMNGDSLLVDVNLSSIKESYQASNGKIYILNAVDVKMYNNKIKEQLIEGENYMDRWDGQDGWEVRYRPWASGGKDVVLKGTTRNVFSYYIWDSTGDSILSTSSGTRTFQMHHRTASERFISKSSNAYLKYEPVMYSVPYKIYWRAYDDKPNHFFSITGLLYEKSGTEYIPLYTIEETETGTDTIPYTKEWGMVLEQKLLISFPGKPALSRSSDALIHNHFSSKTLMAGISTAGVMEETLLTRYNAAAEDKMYMLATSLTAMASLNNNEDAFGKAEILKCPSYGKATFFVSNTVRERDANAGAIFLDYIRLVPQIDPSE